MQNFHSHTYASAKNCESLAGNLIGLKPESSIKNIGIRQSHISNIWPNAVYDLHNSIF